MLCLWIFLFFRLLLVLLLAAVVSCRLFFATVDVVLGRCFRFSLTLIFFLSFLFSFFIFALIEGWVCVGVWEGDGGGCLVAKNECVEIVSYCHRTPTLYTIGRVLRTDLNFFEFPYFS